MAGVPLGALPAVEIQQDSSCIQVVVNVLEVLPVHAQLEKFEAFEDSLVRLFDDPETLRDKAILVAHVSILVDVGATSIICFGVEVCAFFLGGAQLSWLLGWGSGSRRVCAPKVLQCYNITNIRKSLAKYYKKTLPR